MAGGKESRDEKRDNGKTNTVLGELGYQDFDEARPKHAAKIMDSHNTHGWVIAAFLHEMLRLSGKAMKAVSLLFDACDKEASKLFACGKRWQPRSRPT